MWVGLPRRARICLIGAAVGVLLLALTWYLAHYVAVFRRADVNILTGFAQLNRPGLDRLTTFLAELCDPQQYVLLAVIPVVVALLRRRLRVAVTIAVILLAANETTQLLKPLLVAPRDPVWALLGEATWPSGHATASMSLALCMVLAAPARWRPAVAAAMAAFALAVCYSFLELGWHYPSDVLGGFLVAGTWTLLGIAGLTIYEARRPARARPAAAGADGADGAAHRSAPVSVVQALTPMAAMLAGGAVLVALVLIARPHAVISYARGHEAFVVGAGGIAVLGLALAAGLALMLRRG